VTPTPVPNKAYTICSWLIVALGCVHLAFTFHDYDEVSMRAFYFFGSGLTIIFAGFLNVALIRDGGRDHVIKLLCLIANVACALLFAAALLMMRQPQVFVGVALFAFVTVAALRKG
jgi:peptidoglycan/LPS O-acetylase OafA/YrhL